MPEEEQQRSSDNLQVDKGILASLKLDTILGWVIILLKLNIICSVFTYGKFTDKMTDCKQCPIVCYKRQHTCENITTKVIFLSDEDGFPLTSIRI